MYPFQAEVPLVSIPLRPSLNCAPSQVSPMAMSILTGRRALQGVDPHGNDSPGLPRTCMGALHPLSAATDALSLDTSY